MGSLVKMENGLYTMKHAKHAGNLAPFQKDSVWLPQRLGQEGAIKDSRKVKDQKAAP
jgi:hypothetical protein